MLTARSTSLKAFHLAEMNAGFLFLIYGIMIPLNVVFSLVPILGIIITQILSTFVSLGIFLQLRKVILKEKPKPELKEVTAATQKSETVIGYFVCYAVFFLPVALAIGILQVMGAFNLNSGTPDQPFQMNPGFTIPILIAFVFSCLYSAFFAFPSIVFALDLAIVKGVSLKDAFALSFQAVYKNFAYLLKVAIIQSIPIIMGAIVFVVLNAIFKDNAAQVMILEVGLYVLVLLPMFAYLAGLRAVVYCELFDQPEAQANPSSQDHSQVQEPEHPPVSTTDSK